MNTTEAWQKGQTPGTTMRYEVWACCAAVLISVIGYFAIIGISGGAINTTTLLAPLFLCVGVHLVMHRFMRETCHGTAGGKGATAKTTPVQIGREIASE